MAGKRRGKAKWGEGSIFRTQDGAGWIVKVYDGNGKTIRRRAATAEAAETIRQELIRQRDSGVNLEAASQTMQQFLTMWLNEVAIPRGIRPKTERYYRQMIESYVLPYMGNKRLRDLKPADVQGLLNHLRAHDLSDQTVRHVFSVLKNALGTAEKWRSIDRNPCALIDVPRVKEKRDGQPLAVAQVRALLNAVAGHRLALLYRIAVTLGLREGEILGLQWRDIDLDKATLTVARQAQSLTGKGTQLVEPKSKTSVRVLPLPPSLAAQLRTYRLAEQKAVLEAEHQTWSEERLLFGTSNQTPLQVRNLMRHFKPACVKAGILLRDTGKKTEEGAPIYASDLRFHDLRHTCASLLVEAGVGEAVIAAILGHSSGSVTRRYSHVSLDTMRQALTLVEQQLAKKAA